MNYDKAKARARAVNFTQPKPNLKLHFLTTLRLNISPVRNKCPMCKESMQDIISLINRGERFTVIFNPSKNASDITEQYHIDVKK